MSDAHVVQAFRRAVRDTGASPMVSKALFESGIVESHLQNLNYGDRDSKGPLQQRRSQGWTHATDPYGAALDFISHAKAVQHLYGDAGSLAQAVQRSAFPARYAKAGAQADAFRRGLGGSAGGSEPAPRGPAAVTPGAPVTDNNAAITDALATPHRPGSNVVGLILSKLASGQYTTPAARAATTSRSSSAGSASGGGLDARLQNINDAHLPYKWGGGHAGRVTGRPIPVDCSGAVSEALGINPRVASQFMQWGKPGKDPRGKLTIWAKSTHVILERNGHFWGTSAANKGGGAGWIPRSQISASYLAGFTPRHA